MIALAYIFFFMVYCTVSFCVILLGYRFAKKYFQKGWIGGLIAGLVMYNLVFWDLIPVLIMHKHYCATQAGYWEYQSAEEWVEQHPEVWGQDWSDQSKWKHEKYNSKNGHKVRKTWISPYIYYEYESYDIQLEAIGGGIQTIFDAKSKEVLSKAIEFGRGKTGELGGSWSGMKFWLAMGNRTCGSKNIIGNGHGNYRMNSVTYINNLVESVKKRRLENNEH